MLAVVLFTALPKVYIHKMMGHDHSAQQHKAGAGLFFTAPVKASNCELEKFETPVYFTIFKVILNCTPFKQHTASVSYNTQQEDAVQRNTDTSLLRGPPTV